MTLPSLPTVYVGLGSNLGDKMANLQRALQSLEAAGVSISSLSPVYSTEPVDLRNQDWFLNQVAGLQTRLEPKQFLLTCKDIEKAMGRKPTLSKGPRVIDLDILFYMDRIIHDPELTIPHPAIATRRFVLVPLSDIAPEFVHPEYHTTIRKLLQDCQDPSQVLPLVENTSQIAYNPHKTN